MLKYKGYIGNFYFDEKVGLFQGNVANSNDILTFQGKSIAVLQQAFLAVVDECLAAKHQTKESNGLLPNKIEALKRGTKLQS